MDERQGAAVVAFAPEQIKSPDAVVNRPALQSGQADVLAVDHDVGQLGLMQRGNQIGEAPAEVMRIARGQRDGIAVDVDLEAPGVLLQFVLPIVARRRNCTPGRNSRTNLTLRTGPASPCLVKDERRWFHKTLGTPLRPLAFRRKPRTA